MDSRAPVTVLILTYNEEINVEHCLKSAHEWASEIIIVDSFSTAGTLEICRKYTDRIYQHPFENHGKQVNWALENLPIASEWVLQLDADEMVTLELVEEICQTLPHLPDDVTGVYMKRRVYFLGRWMRHGDYYPIWLLRLFRRGCARNEEFEEDRVILLKGRAVHFKHDFIDYNRKGLTFWTNKHNAWATNEARDTVLQARNEDAAQASILPALRGTQDQRRRWLKKNIYGRSPLFVRAFVYFTYRYFLRLGFLDGVEGLIFHFLHGLWYRFYVDAKIYVSRRPDLEGQI